MSSISTSLISATRARRVGGQLHRIVSDQALRPAWLRGDTVALTYTTTAQVFVLGWRAAGRQLVPAEVVPERLGLGTTVLASADDPDASLWSDEPTGFFRRGGA